MLDLNEIMESAASKKEDWDKSKFLELLVYFSSILESPVEWDAFSPEGWGAVFTTDELKARICLLVPLVFVKSSYLDLVKSKCESLNVIIIAVESFDDEFLTYDRDILLKILDIGPCGIGEENPDSPISVNDLWFHTV